MDSTCAICMENVEETYYTNCKHNFCQKCLLRYLQTCGTCPICRQIIESLSPCPEHDFLVEMKGRHFGMTLTDEREGRVVVSKLDRRDVAREFLRVGDCITHVNGVPIFTHSVATALINKVTEEGGEMTINSERKWKKNKGGYVRLS
jgi:hypothetical protein